MTAEFEKLTVQLGNLTAELGKSTALAWDATSEDIQSVLESLSSISKVSVSARQEICPLGCEFHGFCSVSTDTSCGHNSHCPTTETCTKHNPNKFGFVYTVTFGSGAATVLEALQPKKEKRPSSSI